MFGRPSRARLIPVVAAALTGLACEGGDALAALKPALSGAPTALDFGDVPVGATRRLPLVLSSVGTGPVRVSRAEADQPAVVLPSVTATLAPGRSLAVSIGFRPQATGEVRATLRVFSDDPRGAVSIELTGRGVDATAIVSPLALDLGAVPVGSTAQTGLTVTRLGEAALAATVALDAPRAEHFTVGPSALVLDASPVGTIDLDYAPVAAGVDDATLRILTCGADCGLEVPVAAQALEASLRAIPTVVDFEARAPGSSTLLPLVLTNVAGLPITVRSIDVRGPPSLTVRAARALPIVIGPGASASIDVSWSPTDASPLDATIAVGSDLEALPTLRVPVRGFVELGALEVTPEAIDFGVVRVGRAGLRRPFLLANGGRGTVRVTSASIVGAPGIRLGAELTPPFTLASGESITGSVELDALPEGTRTATLTILSDAPASPRVELPVRVTASDAACDFVLEPGRSNLGYAPAGVLRRGALTLRNRGTTPCTIDRVVLRATSAPEFTLVDVPPLPLALGPAATATLGITILGSGRDTYRADVDASATGDVPTSARAVVLASGAARGQCLTIDPIEIDLGLIGVGELRGATVLAQNIGNTPCSLTRVARTSGSSAWTVGALAGGALAPGQTVRIPVEVLTPSAELAEAVVTIETDDPLLRSVDVRLRAVSLDPLLCVDPPTLHFANPMMVNDARVQLRACGTSSVDLLDVDWAQGDAELALPQRVPAQTLQPGQTIDVLVRFTPTDNLADNATLRVRSNDPVAPEREVQVTTGVSIVPPSAGRSLYFWRIDGAASDVAKLSLQGPPAVQIIEGPSVGGPCVGCHAVSRDGQYLGMIAVGARMELLIRDTRSGRAFTSAVSNPIGLSFEPVAGSTRLAYVDVQGRLNLSDLTGRMVTPLAQGASPAAGRAGPSWGSDGFVYFADDTGQLRMVPAAGGPSQVLAGGQPPSQAAYVFPAISPDARWLAFTEVSVFGSSIVIINTTVGMPINTLTINRLSKDVSYPTWSVDGRFLSFAARQAATSYDLFVVPFDTQTGMVSPPTIIPGGDSFAFEHGAVWSP